MITGRWEKLTTQLVSYVAELAYTTDKIRVSEMISSSSSDLDAIVNNDHIDSPLMNALDSLTG